LSKVSILLSTHNGDKYLQGQLLSLFSQSCISFNVVARDDGSSDNSKKILKSYNVEILSSDENTGVKKSFSKLLEYALKSTNSNYFMFSDQDDVWKEDKIEKTMQKIQEIEREYPDKPILIHTDLEVVDENLQTIDKSFWHFENIDPSSNAFNKLLMQNTITGCTVMINRKLAELTLPIPDEAIMHDWWLGLVASKFGKIAYVNEPLIKYRQHKKNSIGAKGFKIKTIVRKFFIELPMKDNLVQAQKFLNQYRDSLDEESITMLEDFVSIESKSFWQKRKVLLKYGLLKQGFIRNMGLLLKI